MTSNEDENRRDPRYSEVSDIGNRVRYVQRRIDEMGEQMDEHYHLLREIWESTVGRENGSTWYDLADEGDEAFFYSE